MIFVSDNSNLEKIILVGVIINVYRDRLILQFFVGNQFVIVFENVVIGIFVVCLIVIDNDKVVSVFIDL